MLSRRLPLLAPRATPICLLCAARGCLPRLQERPFSSTLRQAEKKASASSSKEPRGQDASVKGTLPRKPGRKRATVRKIVKDSLAVIPNAREDSRRRHFERGLLLAASRKSDPEPEDAPVRRIATKGKSLKEALLAEHDDEGEDTSTKKGRRRRSKTTDKLNIGVLKAEDVSFEPVNVHVPPIPMLSYGLDRVLFNPGVYRLQDPRSRVYNFDPYLEKIMAVDEFDFAALSEYKTSSKDEELLAMTKRLGTKFTGSTSSMSGILQHFHYLLSASRELNHNMLSRDFPKPSSKFSKVTLGPSAVLLRWKDGLYAIDADKSYDKPNIMSWLGHSLEKLLTTERDEFERFRRSSPDAAPKEDNTGRCYHYSTLGNFLMRSQLDAHDPRLPGSGVFDVKTRAVVSIRMDHEEYETGSGYQLRYDRGEWESFEREFYDMTRATMLKYSLQVRMGRMDGIFVAYHNIERIFGFQYLSLPDLDNVLHGQTDTCLGDQEFRFSIRLLDEVMQKATEAFPEQTLRFHFHSKGTKSPFMYIFAEPITDEQADEMQDTHKEEYKNFERDIVGVDRDDPEVQKQWHDLQDRVDDEVDEEQIMGQNGESSETEESAQTKVVEEGGGDEEPIEAESSPSAKGRAATQNTTSNPQKADSGPLMGWTLVIRNIVNGHYVDRPENLGPSDNWTIEYHIKEISPDTRQNLYSKVKELRKSLIGQDAAEQTKSLEVYRRIIRNYSERGRTWREEQDDIDEELGQRVYEPLGPGSQAGGETQS